MKKANTLIKAINKMFQVNVLGETNERDCAMQRGDGTVVVHTENGHYCLDGYGEFQGGGQWVDPKLEKLIEKSGWSYEWLHPGSIELFRD